MLTLSSSKLSAKSTKSEKYPKKYCSVMQFLLIILIFVDFVSSCLIDFIAPYIPQMIKKINKIIENEFKILKDKLSFKISIKILTKTKKYKGTKALKYNNIFFKIIFVLFAKNKNINIIKTITLKLNIRSTVNYLIIKGNFKLPFIML